MAEGTRTRGNQVAPAFLVGEVVRIDPPQGVRAEIIGTIVHGPEPGSDGRDWFLVYTGKGAAPIQARPEQLHHGHFTKPVWVDDD